MCCCSSCYAKVTSVRCYRQCYFIRLGCLLSLLKCGPYWGCAAPKGHFLSPDSLAKGIFFFRSPSPRAYFFTKTPKYCHLGAKLASVFGKFLLKREYLGWNSLKWCNHGLMIRKMSLAKGMFSTKISLAKGIRSKTGAAHPLQIFFGVPPYHTPQESCCQLVWGQDVTRLPHLTI